MKVDLLYEIQAPKPWGKKHPFGQREAEQRAYADALAQVKLADKVGFGTAWFVEHHFREGRSHMPAPEVVIGALSQITERIRLGFGVTLLPHGFTHPARVAEKVATADILSHGRVEWGTGRSTPMERSAFHVPEDRNKEMWKEAVEAIVSMWESERFSWDSEFLKMPERAITPKPYQWPHPPAWLAAVSDESAESAGRNALGLLLMAILTPVETVKGRIDKYRAAQKEAKPLTRIHNEEAAVYTLVHCAPSMAQAEGYGVWDSVWWWYQHIAEFTLEWEFPHWSQEQKDKQFPFLAKHRDGELDPHEFNDHDMIIVGDPDTCLEKIERYKEAGADHLLCYMQFGQLSHESIMQSIELIGTKVIPKLEQSERRTHIVL
jgi:alkanesulfonate monooxygenase SsuD/methylene tetrahydromethanopterin reductase-like flavin-dependent oxidoreductase (luciferase family)